MLCLNGFTYTAKKRSNGWIRWTCSVSRSAGCPGSVTDETPIVNPRTQKQHNHAADYTMVEVTKFRANLKEESRRNFGTKTGRILVSGIQNLFPNAIPRGSKVDTVKRDIQRQKAKNRPAEPATIQGINIQFPWNTTGGLTPRPFLIHDSGPVADRVLVFATNEGLQHLGRSPFWYIGW